MKRLVALAAACCFCAGIVLMGNEDAAAGKRIKCDKLLKDAEKEINKYTENRPAKAVWILDGHGNLWTCLPDTCTACPADEVDGQTLPSGDVFSWLRTIKNPTETDPCYTVNGQSYCW